MTMMVGMTESQMMMNRKMGKKRNRVIMIQKFKNKIPNNPLPNLKLKVKLLLLMMEANQKRLLKNKLRIITKRKEV